MKSGTHFKPVSRPDLPSITRRRLLEAIGRDYGMRLPSERNLCHELGVSRPTLRAALQQLESERVLERRGGRGERFVARKPARRQSAPQIVRILQDGSAACFLGGHLATVGFLSDLVHGLGYHLSIETNRACFSGNPVLALQKLAASTRADLWILHRSTRAMQTWFAKSGIPALILGSAWEETGLPSVDVDHASACRHAAGMLIARGHTNLALLHPTPLRRGDTAGIESFVQAARSTNAAAVKCAAGAHDGTVAGICGLVDRLLRSKQRPDGWVVFGADCFLTVVSHLAARGLSPGRDLSVISRDFDPLLESLVPPPAHYRRDLNRMHHHLARLIRSLTERRPATGTQLTFEAVFHDGATLCTPEKPPAPRGLAPSTLPA